MLWRISIFGAASSAFVRADREVLAPEVITYSGDRLLEEMGPARACGASIPACPISD